jgi:hypothetical protein
MLNIGRRMPKENMNSDLLTENLQNLVAESQMMWLS